MDLDSSTSASTSNDLITLTADVVSAYLSKNSVAATEVPVLIASVHDAFTKVGEPAAPTAPTYEPKVPIRKSITPDALISLIDGRPYKVLKRHLTKHGLTMEARRSELAKAAGLGQQRRKHGTVASKGRRAKALA